jgi:ring-1,2-phenylacetyl-CoA epoxidase subunit PaaC
VTEAHAPEGPAREALDEVLLTLADDEFVLGFWDSEWTGIAPMLEEDVAFSSLAQDEIGHARALYGILAQLTGSDADRIAFGREPHEYRHCRLLDHPRTDWAFSVARRYLYDTADSVRLEALASSSYAPLAELVAKIRREETYHLMHGDAWLRRLAQGRGEPRQRVERALATLGADAATVFTPLAGEAELIAAGILPVPMIELRERWRGRLEPTFRELGLPMLPGEDPAPGGRGPEHGADFRWLWGEFTAVARLEPEAVW